MQRGSAQRAAVKRKTPPGAPPPLLTTAVSALATCRSPAAPRSWVPDRHLPANLPQNPNYRKVNSSDSPMFILALTSDVLDRGQMYDAASSIVAQKIAQIKGVGEVSVSGSALPAVRIELNPMALHKYGIGLETVRSVLNSANANTPKGHFSDHNRIWEVGANDQLFKASFYAPLIVAYHNGMAVRVSDIGEAVDSVEDLRNAGFFNKHPAVIVATFRTPGPISSRPWTRSAR